MQIFTPRHFKWNDLFGRSVLRLQRITVPANQRILRKRPATKSAGLRHFMQSFLLLLLFVGSQAINAQDVNVVANPLSTTENIGDPFSIIIALQSASNQDISIAELHMDFDPAILQVTSVDELATGALPVPVVSLAFDNVLGTIDYGIGTFSSFPEANFNFIQINLQSIATGSTTIDFSDDAPFSIIAFEGLDVTGSTNSIPVTINGIDNPPTVSITSPADNDNFIAGSNVPVTADAADDVAITQVELFIDGFATGQVDTAAPYEFSINNIAQGSYVLTAVASDGVNIPTTSDPINISVDPPVDNPPLVSISSPADGATFTEGDNVTVDVTASDDIGVTGVELFNGAASLGVDNTAPYSFAINNIAAGVYNLTAEASDINTSTTSAQVNITVSVADTAPVITLAATSSVNEGSNVSVPLSITDADGDNLTVTITTLSNEPLELQTNQDSGGIQREPYPFDANAFFNESAINNNPGSYSSSLDFNPVFGDGGSDGDGNGTYDVNVNVTDEDGNSIDQLLTLTVNDTDQFISNSLTVPTRIQNESYDDQGNSGGGDGIGIEEAGTGFIVGFTTAGDFAEYQIDVQTAGVYQMDFFVARDPAGAKDMEITTTAANATLVVNDTGTWADFTTVTVNVAFNAGPQTLRFDWNDGGGFYMNMDYFDMILLEDPDLSPVILVADVEAAAGPALDINFQVTDEDYPGLITTAVIYDKSVLPPNNPTLPTNTDPFTSGATIANTLTDDGAGGFTLSLAAGIPGRSYLARITSDDGVNPAVTEDFTINIAQMIPATILAKTFSNPLPYYGSTAPQNGYTVTIENNAVENIGYVDPGDFVEYFINVPVAGDYNVEFFAGKGNTGTLTTTLSEENGGGFSPIGSFGATNTGWQTYASYQFQVTFSNSGIQTLRLDFTGGGGVNIRDFNFSPTNDLAPTIDAIADVEIDEGGTVNVGIQVNDDFNPSATIIIYDKSEPLGNNSPYTPAAVVNPADYTFTDNGSGSYTLNWVTSIGDGRSYEARVTADDGANPTVEERFTINVAQDITPGVILARTFSNPLPHYGGSPSGSAGQDFSVAIENAGNIGWIDNNDFVEYLIDVPAGGNYDFRVFASNGTGTTNTFTLLGENGGGFIPLTSIDVENNGGWNGFNPYIETITFLNPGLQTIRFEFTGGTNITEFDFTPNNSNAAPLVFITSPVDGFAAEQGTDITFSATANDPEDGDIATNLVWTSDIDNSIGSGASFNTTGLSVGTHIITAEATDNDGSDPQTGSASITVIIGPAAPNCDVAFRVNSGGPVYASADGDFEADQSVSDNGGTAQSGTPSPYINTGGGAVDKTFGSTTPLVSNTTGYPDYLFQTERWSDAANPDNMNWTFPTGDGTFEVSILFNENWSGELNNPRVFDVNVEGVLELDDYRPSVDGTEINIAKVETFLVVVTDGELNIDFIKGTQNPSVKGFSICAVNAAPVVSILAPADNAIVNRGQDITLTGNAIDEEDLDISSDIEWTSDLQFVPNPLNGIGASITAQFITPGAHTLSANVTDSGGENGTASITVNVPGPEIAFDAPLENEVISCTSVDIELDPTNVLFGNDEHFHFFINPADPLNPDGNTRISTAGSAATTFTFDENSGALAANGLGNGIVVGANTIVVVVAAADHSEFTNPEATATVNFTVVVPSVDNLAATDPTDCNVDDGQIVVTATGINLEYSKDGNTFQGSNIFSDLAAGEYTITVREVGNTDCTASDTVTLTAPVAPVISNVASTDPTDCGVDDGTITISATGVDLLYSIDNGANYQAGNTFTGLAGGTYDIVVQENGFPNCTATNQVVLTAPVAPSITNVASTDPTDCGVDDGTITISATGVDLLYSIDNGANYQAANTFTGLAEGTYDIVVQENGSPSCTVADLVVLTAPVAPSITNVASTDPTDCGVDDGTITISATGVDLLYSIDNGANYQAGNTFTGLAEETYDIVVQENGSPSCTATNQVVLTAPVAPSITNVASTDPTDCGVDDGTITVSATGVDLLYSIDNGVSFQAGNTFTALAGGTYDIVVQENGSPGCTETAQVVLTAPVAPSISNVATTDPSDCGTDDGTIIITASGLDLRYSIDNGATFSINNTFTDLAGGNYNIVVVEEGMANCTAATTATLNAPSAPIISAAIATDPTDCGVNDGTITVTASGNNLEYSNDNGVSFQAGNVFAGLAGGLYNIVVRDSNSPSCTASTTANIVAPELPVISNVATTDPSDCGVDDGTIVITASGNNLQYSIDDGITFQAGNSFSGLAEGDYDIVVQSDGLTNCVATTTVTLVLVDTTAPVIVCPANIIATSLDGNDVVVGGIGTASATDSCDPAPTVTGVRGDGMALTDPYPVGTTVITWTAIDAAGNGAQCPQTVMVNFTASAANDIVSFTIPGQVGPATIDDGNHTVNLVVSFPTGLSGLIPAIGVSPFALINPPSGQAQNFDPVIPVPYDVTSQSNVVQQWNVYVSIEPDTTDPTVNCPADITVDNDPGVCGAIVSFMADYDDDRPGVTASSVPASGSLFPAGTTTVTVTATDAAGNTAQCTFDVTVNDTEAPALSVPADITVGNDAGICGAVVSFAPIASDNCPGVTIVNVPASGSVFPVGTTVVTSTATDASGNAAQSTFNVTVNDLEAPTLVCSGDINVQGDENGEAAIADYTASVSGSDNCPGVVVTQSPILGSIISGTTTVTMTATDAAGLISTCTFDITVDETPTVLSVISFTLVNAGNEQDIMNLMEGDIIDINSLPTTNLNIRANTTDDTESVRLVLSGAKSKGQTENFAPYALYGDSSGNYAGSNFIIGNYTILATPYSANGLNGTQGTPLTVNFQLSDQDPLCIGFNASITAVTNPTTCGGSNGSATAQPQNGTGPFSYLWSNGNTNQTANNLNAGTHTVTVTDNNGCTVVKSVTLSDPALPVVTLAALASPVLTTDGPVTLNGAPAGGTYSGPGVSGNQFNPGVAGVGTHQITYSYTNTATGCSNSASRSITVTTPTSNAALIILDSNTDLPLFALTDGLELQKSNIPWGIVYNPNLNPNGIFFSLTGPINQNKAEGSSPPYSVFGDIGTNVLGQVFPVGNYRLVANPNVGATVIVNFSVVDGPPQNQNPIAVAVGNADPVDAFKVNFSGASSIDNDGNIVEYSWDFGDGNTFVSASPTAMHTYGSAGVRTVTLTVEDDDGATGSTTIQVEAIDPDDVIKVISFTLVDGVTDNDLFLIDDGDNIADGAGKNIRANTDPGVVGSVKFVLSGAASRTWTESVAPYALYADNAGNYSAHTFPNGSYTLTATPYEGAGGSGAAGQPLTVNFTVGLFLPSMEPINSVMVTPNPADREASLVFDTPAQLKEVLIYDVTGRLIKRVKADDSKDVGVYLLQVQDLPAGTYFVRARDVQGTEFQQQMAIKR